MDGLGRRAGVARSFSVAPASSSHLIAPSAAAPPYPSRQRRALQGAYTNHAAAYAPQYGAQPAVQHQYAAGEIVWMVRACL